MPGCGEEVPEELRRQLDRGSFTPVPMPSGPPMPCDDVSPDTNKPFVRDMTYEELEELIEKCVRRVLQGEDIKREFERLKAAEKR